VSVRFIEQLGAEWAGAKATLLWDGLSSHWSRRMKQFLATHGSSITRRSRRLTLP